MMIKIRNNVKMKALFEAGAMLAPFPINRNDTKDQARRAGEMKGVELHTYIHTLVSFLSASSNAFLHDQRQSLHILTPMNEKLSSKASQE